MLEVINRSRATTMGTHVRHAARWWERLRGLLGRPRLEAGEGLLITPCSAVHTYGMGYPIDVAFLDREGRVLALYPALPPGTRSRMHRGAAHALELPAGTLSATGTQVGDELGWHPARESTAAARGGA